MKEIATNGNLLLDFIKQHYEVPDNLVGFTIAVMVNEPVLAEWKTYLTKKDSNNETTKLI